MPFTDELDIAEEQERMAEEIKDKRIGIFLVITIILTICMTIVITVSSSPELLEFIFGGK